MHLWGDTPTVMVVDDQQVNQDLLSSILSREGFRVCVAESGERALELLDACCPDAVLLDVVMPGMNGFECLQRIRRRFDATELPVIMATVDADRDSTVAALHHGANDYVTKPFDPDVLLARTRGHVRLRQLAQQLRVSEERYALAAEGSNAGLYDWNIAQNCIYLAPRWKELLGYGPDELPDLPEEWLNRIHPDDLDDFRMLTDDRVSLDAHVELEMRMRHRDGRYRWMRCTGVLQRDQHGGVRRLAGSLADVTAGKVRDPLTGLPNRLLFEDRLDMALQSGELVGVLFLDLDDFKLVNDSLGHHVGDQLLVSVAERLCSTVCDSPNMERSRTVARMGGDEFAILVEKADALSDLELLAQQLLTALAAPHQIESHEVSAPGSIGIATAEGRSKVAADMLREADTAMYHAKASDGSRLRVFDPEMRQRASRRLRLERDLRNALPLEEFYLKYQPIVALASGAIDRFEALARWNRPRQELVDPSVFIPVAEDLGLISEIGTWVLGSACRAAVAWRDALPAHLTPRVAVNVSIRELQQPEFLDLLRATIETTGVEPEQLELELTETTLMSNPALVRNVLSKVRELGVQVAVDDFGTGYSSLSYLHRVPINILKIDRSFVCEMSTSVESFEIVRTIVTLARSLNLLTVAEGIESEEQRKMLLDLGCDYGQGYLFSRPMDGREVIDWVLQTSPAADDLKTPTVDERLEAPSPR